MRGVTLRFENEERVVSESEALYLAEELQSFADVSAAADHLAVRIEREARQLDQEHSPVLPLDASETFELERVLGRADLAGDLTPSLHDLLHAVRA